MTRLVVICMGAAALGAAPAVGANIAFNGGTQQSGTGFGNILNVLSLHNNDSEWGSVTRLGGSDVLAGHATNQSFTRTAGEILASGADINNLGMVFNINEPGSSDEVLLREFTVIFYDATDAVMFSATWSTPLNLAPVNNGTGGAGWIFDLVLTAAERAAFFGDANNRIGMIVPEASPIGNSFDGPENFYLIPSPGSLALVGLGLAGLTRRRPR